MDSGLRRGFATASTQYTPSFFDHLNYHFCLAFTQVPRGEKVMNTNKKHKQIRIQNKLQLQARLIAIVYERGLQCTPSCVN